MGRTGFPRYSAKITQRYLDELPSEAVKASVIEAAARKWSTATGRSSVLIGGLPAMFDALMDANQVPEDVRARVREMW